MKTEEEIKEKITELIVGKSALLHNYVQNEGILIAINTYASSMWIKALEWVLDKE